VLPATAGPVTLKATVGGAEVEGQVRVQESDGGPIDRLGLVPPDPDAPEAVLEAIARAEQIVIGPGSLYTSVLAVVAVPAIGRALQESAAAKVYICNLRTERETTGYDAAAHLLALRAHGVHPDVVVHDPAGLPEGRLRAVHPRVLAAALALPDDRGHDPVRLADVLSGLVR
jgi:uncharacterized cofD-like protein